MKPVRTLHTAPVGNVTTLARPEIDEHLSLESPAQQIFTDFTHHHPIVIDGDLSVEQASALMQRSHVKLTLVVDASPSESVIWYMKLSVPTNDEFGV